MTRAPSSSKVMRGLSTGTLARQIGASIDGDADVVVTGVQQDSRAVEPGDLFVALTGLRSDGTRFIAKALAAGAVAVLVERGTDLASLALSALGDTVPVLFAAAPRQAMADAAAEVHGRATESLEVVGITGTNGKTTTAQLLSHALTHAGARVGVVGTLGYAFEGIDLGASHTSPEADTLQRVARQMLDRGAQDLVMEVSSIALVAERVRGVDFDVAAFSNLTQDHLDYHGSMEAYAAAKDQLFLEHTPRVCVINVDDAHGKPLAERVAKRRPDARLITVSATDASATVYATSSQSRAGLALDVVVAEPVQTQVHIGSKLIGGHNVANLLMALAIGVGLGRDVKRLAEGLGAAPPVPGRLERCDDPATDEVVAVVDYAHTPDALERTLASLREVCDGRLLCVFGCGGDRDAAKRAPMGAVVAAAADRAFVTNDNPRSEDPQDIADAVSAGLIGADYVVMLDRRAAIRAAIAEANAGDVVLVAGKGHETYQIIGERVTDFDDRAEVRAALASRPKRTGQGA